MPRAPATYTGSTRKHEQLRGTRHERGYDHQWDKLRADHLAEHPLCVRCQAAGRITLGVTVDHRVRFRGLDDPLRLDPANLDTLCAQCEKAKTAEERKVARKHGERGNGQQMGDRVS